MDRWRRVGRRPSVAGGEHVLDFPVEGVDPLSDEYTDEMQRALDLLPDDMREALLVVVVGELTHQEAADALDAPLGTILSRVSRARNRLRSNLQSIMAGESSVTATD